MPDASGFSRELREILQCIHDSLFDPDLSVGKVREVCRIRNNNVSSHFRHVMGQGIKEYIESHRMEAARQLLSRDEFVVFEVAMALGYRHVETFYKAFDRHYSCPPAEYGRRLRQGAEELQSSHPG